MIRRLAPLAAAALLTACQAGAGEPIPLPTALPSAEPAPAVPAGAVLVRGLATIPVVARPATIAEAGGFVYVGCAETGTLQAIDPATDKVVKELRQAAGRSSALGTFADGRHLFALDAGQETARVIDPKADHQVLQTVALPGGPSYAVVSPDFAGAMVAMGTAAKATLLTFEGADLGRVPAVRDFGAKPGAATRAIGYDHDWAVLPNGDGTLALIDARTGAGTQLPGSARPGDVHIGVWGGVARQAMAAELDTDAVSLYAIPSGERTTITGLGTGIADLQGEENLRRAYVAMSGSDQLAVIDYDKKRKFGVVPTGKTPTTIAITEQMTKPATRRLQHEEDDNPREVWVGNQGDGTMTVVDANTLRVMAVVKAGQGPHRVAFAGTKAYVANHGDGTVTVVDRAAIK